MIGDQFASRLSGLPRVPQLFADAVRCPVCGGPPGQCVGGPAVHDDAAGEVRSRAVARGQQQTRRAPGRPSPDPEKEAARQAAWEAKQAEAPVVEPEPIEGQAAPVGVTGVDAVASATAPGITPAAEPVVTEAPPAVATPGAEAKVAAAPLPADQKVLTSDGGSPNLTLSPTLVRGPEAGSFKSQGVAPGAVTPFPAGEPTEIQDVYLVPDGCMDPVDDPHRPDPAQTVLVSDEGLLASTGAWMTMPGGSTVACTKDVLKVFWPVGTLAPSYSMVAAQGAVLPKPVAAA